MVKGFTRNGKFVPTGNDSESGISSDQVQDDSQEESVNASDAEEIKKAKSD